MSNSVKPVPTQSRVTKYLRKAGAWLPSIIGRIGQTRWMNILPEVMVFLLLIAVVGSLLSMLNESATVRASRGFTILQLNDVYEIAPLPGTDEGGMARVASLRNHYLKADSNVITVLAGDFLSPSVLGARKEQVGNTGVYIAGQHMVAVMNAINVDLVTFGNHEFDIGENDLQKRINESRFDWIAANVLHTTPTGDHRFVKQRSNNNDTIGDYTIRKIYYPGGDKVRVGFIGATIGGDYKYARVSSINKRVRDTYDKIKDSCDVFIALTHLSLKEDIALAKHVPELDLIIGGHEHERNYVRVGRTVISKADANAKTVYKHEITFDPGTRKTKIESILEPINSDIQTDVRVDSLVKWWMKKCDSLLSTEGYDSDSLVFVTTEPLDGREATTRNGPTNFTNLITEAFASAHKDAQGIIFNSGAIRLDDVLKGKITEYDIVRALPYDGWLVMTTMGGDVLTKTLHIGIDTNKNSGGYLQLRNFHLVGKTWHIGGQPIVATGEYKILMPQYMAEGRETNLKFLSQYIKAKPVGNKICKTVIDHLRSKGKGEMTSSVVKSKTATNTKKKNKTGR